jgi:hypothetical protein
MRIKLLAERRVASPSLVKPHGCVDEVPQDDFARFYIAG